MPYRKKYTLFLILVLQINWITLHAQSIFSKVGIYGSSQNETNQIAVHDAEDNYYIGLTRFLSSTHVELDDTLVQSYSQDPFNSAYNLTDFYLLRFNSQHELTGSFVIDNAENVNDFYSDSHHSLIGLSLEKEESPDSNYPILLNGQNEILRDGNRGKGVVVVLDENFEFEKIAIPSTGKLGQVACNGHFAYLEFLIPDGEPYILVGNDTVHNYSGWPITEFADQSIVLCKYDLLTDQVLWTHRMGGAGEEELKDMLIDSEGNLMVHGWTSSGIFEFSEKDSALNYQEFKPFYAKLSPDGEIVWWILRTNQHGEHFYTIKLDNEDNVYCLGNYSWDDYQIGDTIVYNPPWHDIQPTSRAIVIKYNKNGEFQWLHQLEGDYKTGGCVDATFLDDRLILGGEYREGGGLFGSYKHTVELGDDSFFLWELNRQTGAYRAHAFHRDSSLVSLRYMHLDALGVLNMYLVYTGDELFGFPFNRSGGYLLKSSTELINSLPIPTEVSNEILAYPNPLRQGEKIHLKFTSVPYDINIAYSLFDLKGQQLLKGHTIISNSQCDIPLPLLHKGLYAIELQIEGKQYSQIILIQ